VTPVSVGSREPVLLQGVLLADHELLDGTRESLSIRGVRVGAHELDRRLDLPGFHAEDAIQVVRPQDLLRIGEKLPAAGLTDALRVSQQPLQPLAVVVREMRVRRGDAPLYRGCATILVTMTCRPGMGSH